MRAQIVPKCGLGFVLRFVLRFVPKCGLRLRDDDYERKYERDDDDYDYERNYERRGRRGQLRRRR